MKNNIKKNNIKSRILKIAEYKGIKKENFLKLNNLSPSNFRGNAFNMSLRSDFIDKILSKYKDINARWLLTGEGNMVYPEFNKENLIPLYDGVFQANKEGVGFINVAKLFQKSFGFLRITNDSMAPDYTIGSLVSIGHKIDDIDLIVSGQDYVIETKEFRILKRLYVNDNNDYIDCISLNDTVIKTSTKLKYPLFTIPKSKIINIYSVNGLLKFYNISI